MWRILLSAFVSCVVQATDYCKFTPKHILCVPKEFGPDCGDPSRAMTPVITAQMKDLIVSVSNDFRNRVAAGQVSVIDGVLPTAANMEELVWDDELALLAQRYAMKCVYEHSCEDCRRVDRFLLGESMWRTGQGITWKDVIEKWTSGELKHFYVEDVQNMKGVNKGGFNNFQFGHLTQGMWAKTKYIGCGSASYNNGQDKIMWACHYGPAGNYAGSPVYEAGQPCSQCEGGGGCSSTYTNLCAASGRSQNTPPIDNIPGYSSSTQVFANLSLVILSLLTAHRHSSFTL